MPAACRSEKGKKHLDSGDKVLFFNSQYRLAGKLCMQ
jgi:hypothetical protein